MRGSVDAGPLALGGRLRKGAYLAADSICLSSPFTRISMSSRIGNFVKG